MEQLVLLVTCLLVSTSETFFMRFRTLAVVLTACNAIDNVAYIGQASGAGVPVGGRRWHRLNQTGYAGLAAAELFCSTALLRSYLNRCALAARSAPLWAGWQKMARR